MQCARNSLPNAVIAALAFTVLFVKTPEAHAIKARRHAQAADLDAFFSLVDKDGDGQLEDYEVQSYVEQNMGIHDADDMAAAVRMLHDNLEAEDDADETVSQAEMLQHLQIMLQGSRIIDWVIHSLQLPQHAQAFAEHGITAFDLPHLVRDGGQTLMEMGVTMALHRQKIIRGIQRILLGLGQSPSRPRLLHCHPLSCLSARVDWSAPANKGSPAFHKYVLERKVVWREGGLLDEHTWRQVANLTSDDVIYVDKSLQRGVYMYRLKAWNAYHCSEPSDSNSCQTTEPGLPCDADHTASSGWLLSVLSSMAIIGLSIAARSSAMQVKVNRLLTRAVSGRREPGDARQRLLSRNLSSVSSRCSEEANLAANGPTLAHTHHSAGSLSNSQCGVNPCGTSKSLRPYASFGSRSDGGSLPFVLPADVLEASHTSGLPAMPVGCASVVKRAKSMDSTPDTLVAKDKCAFKQCCNRVQWRLLGIKVASSHYCNRCQKRYCAEHTACSPHGRTGDCGVESRCICCICFEELDPVVQNRHLARNKLKRGGDKKGDRKRLERSDSKRLAARLFGSSKESRDSGPSLRT